MTNSAATASARVEVPPLSALLVGFGALLALAMVVSAGIGAVHISPAEVLDALLHPSKASDAAIILYSLRLPRVIAAALVGAALSATGVLFQGLFRNPLADPFVLGASGGAALGCAIAVFLFPALSFAGMSASTAFAFVGALATMAIVWSLAGQGGAAIENLLLAGFAVGTMLNAATSAFETTLEASNPGARIVALWLYGQIGTPTWEQIAVTSLLVLAAVVAALPLARTLNTLALGEEYAAQLGVPVQRVRVQIVMLGALLTALAVSLGGLIGFVGLLVPHVLRLVLGPDQFRLLPLAALAGATFLVITDTAARSVFAPTEVPVGILTAFLGGPMFLYLLHKRRKA
ncbi:MAG TPA: iron ABC transporter permease [candidate division Zixibacteria bacterium]|nr:iron ABC transporter permease [candidate division Zixibacteria bacterium]